MAVGLEFFLGGFPPFLEGRGIENLGSERRGDLIGGCLSTVIAKDVANEGGRVLLSLRLDGGIRMAPR